MVDGIERGQWYTGSGSSLPTSVSSCISRLLVFHHSFACEADHILQLSIMSPKSKTTQKTDLPCTMDGP